DVKPLRQIVSDSVSLKRLALILLSVFAIVALMIASAGIYGVMAYSVTQRTREIGVRMALGARGADVLKLIMRQGLALTLTGVAAGWLVAVALTRLMKSLLFEVSDTDPLTYLFVSALLLAVAMLACWIPTRRATRIDPLNALRHE